MYLYKEIIMYLSYSAGLIFSSMISIKSRNPIVFYLTFLDPDVVIWELRTGFLFPGDRSRQEGCDESVRA